MLLPLPSSIIHVLVHKSAFILHVAKILCVRKNDTITIDLRMTYGVVLRLVEPICGLGHYVYMDNLYTSLTLFAEFHLRACGIHTGVFREVKASLNKGERRSIPLDNTMNGMISELFQSYQHFTRINL